MDRREVELGSSGDEQFTTDWMIGTSVPVPSQGDDVYVIGESASPWDDALAMRAGTGAGAGADSSATTSGSGLTGAPETAETAAVPGVASGRAGRDSLVGDIAPDMTVVGADGDEIGIVARVAADGFQVSRPLQEDLRVSYDLVEATDGSTIRLRVTSADSIGFGEPLDERRAGE